MTFEFRLPGNQAPPMTKPPGPGRSYRSFTEDCMAELDAVRRDEHGERLVARGVQLAPAPPSACPGVAPWPDEARVRSSVDPGAWDLWLSKIHAHADGSLGADPRRAGWINERFGSILGATVTACGASA